MCMDNKANVGKDAMYSGTLGGNIGRGAANFTSAQTPAQPEVKPVVQSTSPVVSEVPSLLKRPAPETSITPEEKQSMASELFDKEYGSEKKVDESVPPNKTSIPLEQIDYTREQAAKAVESTPKPESTNWSAFFEKRSSAPKAANEFLAKALTKLSNVDVFKGVDSPEVRAENIRRGVYDNVLFAESAPTNAKRTSTLVSSPKKKQSDLENKYAFKLLNIPTINAGGM